MACNPSVCNDGRGVDPVERSGACYLHWTVKRWRAVLTVRGIDRAHTEAGRNALVATSGLIPYRLGFR